MRCGHNWCELWIPTIGANHAQCHLALLNTAHCRVIEIIEASFISFSIDRHGYIVIVLILNKLVMFRHVIPVIDSCGMNLSSFLIEVACAGAKGAATTE